MLGTDTDFATGRQKLIPVIVSSLCTGKLDVRNTHVGGMSLRVDGSLQLPVSFDGSKHRMILIPSLDLKRVGHPTFSPLESLPSSDGADLGLSEIR